MHILHVIPGLTRERGGTTAVVQALSHHQAAAGHDVLVLTTDQGARNGEHPAELAPAVRFESHRVRGPDRIAYAPTFRAAVRERLRWCDVAHVYSVFTYPVHATLREALAVGRPVVLNTCGMLHPYSLRRSRWAKRAYLALWGSMLRRAVTAWHYTSDQEAAESWPGSGPQFVLRNGIDAEEFASDRATARQWVWDRWPQLERWPFVLFLSRLHHKKRLDILLEAFLAGAPASHHLIVAGPDEQGSWQQLAQRFLTAPDAARRVHYVGPVVGQEKAALLAGADLFALSSEHENFGIAALEALAAGTPVLLSPHVDLAANVEPTGFGFTAPLEVQAWSQRLAELLAQPDRLAALAGPARAWAVERHSWAGITAELLQKYQLLLPGAAEDRRASRAAEISTEQVGKL